LWFEQVRGVGGALRRSGADESMQLVDEENDPPLAGGDFLEKRFEAVLELAAILRAGDHRAQIHRHQFLVFE